MEAIDRTHGDPAEQSGIKSATQLPLLFGPGDLTSDSVGYRNDRKVGGTFSEIRSSLQAMEAQMALDFLNPESLTGLGQAIRRKRESLGLTQVALADKAGYTGRIVRAIEHGERTKLQTLRDVCEAIGLPADSYEINDNIISDPKYGSYNISHYADYIGIYFGFRHGLTVQNNFLRTVYEISWSGKKRCLEFLENQKYTSPNGRVQNYSQEGDIYIRNLTGMMHLLTSFRGSLRLITLCKMKKDDSIFEGVIMTQIEGSHYYSPGVSPFYLKKVEGVTDRDSLSEHVGNIFPDDDAYRETALYLEEIQREVARFSPMFLLDPKVTRLSSRVSKQRT